jgi:hypothetical protein
MEDSNSYVVTRFHGITKWRPRSQTVENSTQRRKPAGFGAGTKVIDDVCSEYWLTCFHLNLCYKDHHILIHVSR